MSAPVALAVGLASALLSGSAVVLALLWRASAGRARHRLEWLAAALVASLGAAVVAAALSVLVGRPAPWSGLVVALAAVPAAVVAGHVDAVGRMGPAVLVRTIVGTGVAVMAVAVFLLVVVGFGHVPEDDERSAVVLSLVAAVVMAVLAVPVGRRLGTWARRQVYGDERAPRDALRAFGGRMTRAVPMDELMLQLVELLKRNLSLGAVEVWTTPGQGSAGVLERSVSLPERGPRRLRIGDDERAVLARAHAQGRTWLSVWVPEVLAGRPDGVVVRSVSIAHLGELLGLVVLERPPGSDPFTEDEDGELVDLARQLGLALHNMGLDSALQASLEELEQSNAELVASRARLVAAADESRRGIERDLHDGAQQHLVALAVKVGLLQSLIRSDPDAAEAMLAELRDDVQATVRELRDLAHGIYPPLLRDRGLGEALRSAAARAPLPVTVDGHPGRRYPPEMEAALYFCCMEALQNAVKHAGVAEVRVQVGHDDTGLWLEVVDSGRGFDAESTAAGRGFVNMSDRIGALGGSLSVESRPGGGTMVRALVPLSGDGPTIDEAGDRPAG